MDIHVVFATYFGDKKYTIRGETVEWLDPSPQPSPQEIAMLWEKYKSEEAYKAKRLEAYRYGNIDTNTLVLALWDRIMENNPEPSNELQAKRLDIKEKIPATTETIGPDKVKK